MAPPTQRAAAHALARAFHADPAWTWIFPDDDRRTRLLPFVFGRALRLEALRGHVHVLEHGAAVAVWVPPGAPRVTLSSRIRSGIFALPLRLSRLERERLRRYLALCNELQRTVSPGAHWYLSGLAVDPARQGEGLGSKLLAWGCAQAAVERRPVVLLTSNAANIPFYERRGFVVVAQRGDPIPMWAMLLS